VSARTDPTDPTDQITERRLDLALWAGILAGPLAWGLHLQVSYSLTQTACDTGHQWLFHLVSLGALLLAAAGGVNARRLWRRLPAGSMNEGEELWTRSRFMALFGMAFSAFFALVILAQWIPSWILGACAH
jgi:hypothetical protein